MHVGVGVRVLGERRLGGKPYLLLDVKTRRGAVFLCLENAERSAGTRHIAVVDCAKLAQVWRQDLGYREGFDWERPTTWSRDKHFASVDRELPNGETDPIAVARASARELQVAADSQPWRRLIGLRPPTRPELEISLRDGIFSTLWLLCNGARSLPLECDTRSEAELLQRWIGAPGATVHSLAALRTQLGSAVPA
jgi:hypothetical protein